MERRTEKSYLSKRTESRFVKESHPMNLDFVLVGYSRGATIFKFAAKMFKIAPSPIE